jgi:hypothetical protein
MTAKALSQLIPDFDRATVAELARVLEQRLERLDEHQDGCAHCRDAEAVAFLARLRSWLHHAG